MNLSGRATSDGMGVIGAGLELLDLGAHLLELLVFHSEGTSLRVERGPQGV